MCGYVIHRWRKAATDCKMSYSQLSCLPNSLYQNKIFTDSRQSPVGKPSFHDKLRCSWMDAKMFIFFTNLCSQLIVVCNNDRMEQKNWIHVSLLSSPNPVMRKIVGKRKYNEETPQHCLSVTVRWYEGALKGLHKILSCFVWKCSKVCFCHPNLENVQADVKHRQLFQTEKVNPKEERLS